MTDTAPEPTNADVLAFMQSAFTHLSTQVAGVKADIEGVKTDIEGVKTDIEGVKADIEGVKTDIEGVKADIAGVKAEVRAVEAGLISRIDSVQQVVRSVKADISRHMNDGHDHRHAA